MPNKSIAVPLAGTNKRRTNRQISGDDLGMWHRRDLQHCDAIHIEPVWEHLTDTAFALPDFPLEFELPELLVDAYDASAEVTSPKERDQEASILTTYYEIAASATADPGDLISSRFRDGANATMLAELFERYDE